MSQAHWIIYQITEDGTAKDIAHCPDTWERGEFKPGMSRSKVALTLENARGKEGYWLKTGDIKKYLGSDYAQARTEAQHHGIRLKPRTLRR